MGSFEVEGGESDEEGKEEGEKERKREAARRWTSTVPAGGSRRQYSSCRCYPSPVRSSAALADLARQSSCATTSLRS